MASNPQSVVHITYVKLISFLFLDSAERSNHKDTRIT